MRSAFSIPYSGKVWSSEKRIFMHYSLILGLLKKTSQVWSYTIYGGEVRHLLWFDVYAVIAYNKRYAQFIRSDGCHHSKDTS